MKEFKTAQLIEMKKDLEYCIKSISSALEIRSRLIECSSTSQLEKDKHNFANYPSSYYNFRYEHKGVEINRTKNYWFVRTYNFIPKYVNQKLLVSCANGYNNYRVSSFDDAIYIFYKSIQSLFDSILNTELPFYEDVTL